MKKILYILLLLWLPLGTVVQRTYAQKTLKELVAEEKARKEAEKAEREAERQAQEQRAKSKEQRATSSDSQTSSASSPEEAADYVTETDSAIWAPTRVKQLGAQNYGDLTLPKSSLDLNDPDNITTTVEYQPETGTYVIRTKIGDVDITTPYMLTQEEYNHYAERQIMHSYWQQKIGEVEHNNEKKFDITDMKFNIGPADKVFGPGGVQLKMQGSAELLFGFKHQYIANPSLTVRARNNNIFNFDEKIQASIQGKVGTKLNFNMSYNTEASFAFDQQNLKLNYKGEEDDIIQSLEAGNVTMDLPSNLIRGSQALFGIKANLKFGKFKIQALVSQQNSEAQTVSSKGGAQMTKFDVSGDNYDENRHFFLSHFFRDRYEKAMETVPYVSSGFTINKIEVWITNKRGNYDQARNIVAFVDLGENNEHIQLPTWSGISGGAPDNKTNNLYVTVNNAAGNYRDLQQTSTVLGDLGLEGGTDYEKIESARLLTGSEYTLNSSLGYISLKAALNQDEVLAVAYEYTYNGQVYQVGEFSTDNVSDSISEKQMKSPSALALKMLKSSANAPREKNRGTWDLMMKNIYALGATSIQQDKFELYVTYRNDSVGTDIQYLDEGPIKGKQLIRVMNLDRLDQKHNVSPDGRFDFIEGLTVYASGGKIIFPVLEPFGSHLAATLGNDPALTAKYCYQELYDSTLVVAQELSEKNKFHLTGKYKGTNGSEIRLGAMNIPRGSVTVTAGGATLIENVDYTVDYTMGTVTILNTSILESGTNVDVKLENQSTFSMQRKSLFGAHLEYEFNKDLVIGGTIMHLRERPLTTKVNTGSEPLANTIWGVNGSWKTEMQWLTNAIDKIPWINATAPSTFQINAEFAHLIPGHTNDVGSVGTAYIDDFENTTTNIDVHFPSYWFLASTPSVFEESKINLTRDTAAYNKNRAHLAWYAVDPIFGYPQTNTPEHIKNDLHALSDHRTRIVYQDEIYPNRQEASNVDTKLSVLNLAYYPEERGAYNLCGGELNADGKLKNPKKRWGGIMRKMDNTDFEKANIEYIQFWLMDPALTNPEGYDGQLYINLGDISEDILRDGKKSFEHGLPLSDVDQGRIEPTFWGNIPRTTSTVVAFSNEAGSRAKQDVGLDGLPNDAEFTWPAYARYLHQLDSVLSPATKSAWQADVFSPLNDPAGDNYHYYRGTDYDQQQVSILNRYKRFNGTEGNSPDTEQQTESYGTASTLTPDIEDINQDNTLNEYERYYEYKVLLRPDMMEVGKQHITEKKIRKVTLRDGTVADVTWYQFKIPLRGDSATVRKEGSIRNWKSIRFMRMYMTGFEHETHLRFATLDLVRGDWRQYTRDLAPTGVAVKGTGDINVQTVNIEENSTRTPINYVLPPGVTRQTDPGQAQLIAQNEQAMVLRVTNLSPHDARAMYKNTGYDLRQYKNLQMFVHAEKMESIDPQLKDGDLSCFIRMGSDLRNNYYEYEIPLVLTPPGQYNNNSASDRTIVWPEQNKFDFPLQVLTAAKVARNKAKRAGNENVGITIPYVVYDDANDKPQNKITVLGNPTLEEISTIMIGIRNNGAHDASGEVWVNELRLCQFNEQGGVAAMANATLAISDIAQVNVSGRLETAGYGSIESNVLDRNLDNFYQLNVSAALEAGRLFPEKAKIQMPLYISYSNETTSPDYDPLDTDVKLKETLETYNTKEEKDSIKQMTNTVHTATSFSLSNLKVNHHYTKKRDLCVDPANFAISASYNKQNEHSPEIETNMTTDHKGSFTYSYNFNPKPWEPFSKVEKVQKVKFLKEMNFYYLPQSWAFNTNMHRTFSHMKMRDLTGGSFEASDLTFSKDFTWDRNVDIKYDFTKNMKFSFQSAMNAIIDEGKYTPEILKGQYFDAEFNHDKYEAWRDTIQRSLAKWGSPYTYQQVFTASWNVPFNRVPGLDALTANASYNANYNWTRTAASTVNGINRGNTVSSVQTWQVDGGINFETWYGKSKYWKSMTQRYTGRGSRRNFKPKNYTQTVALEKGKPVEITHRLNSELVTVAVIDSTGKAVPVSFKPAGNTKVSVTPKTDCPTATVTVTTKDPNERTPKQIAGDMFAYVGTMIRRLQVTYRETNSMTLPGFMPEAGFMGQRKTEGGYAPGFDFAFGFIPSNMMDRALKNNWLSGDTSVVQPSVRAHTSDFDIKLTLEPLPGLKIQLNGKRYIASSNSITYSYGDIQENVTGSFNITQVAIATMFTRIGKQEENFANSAYDQFIANRDVLAARVQSQYNGVTLPDAGFMRGTLFPGQVYDPDKHGRINRNSADVLVPAFLSAYTGRDANKISLNPFLGILSILPNWSITYDGLGKLPWMRDHFKSVTLTHAYTCKYAIGSFGSYSTWVGVDNSNKQVGFVRDVTTDAPRPSSAYDISNVTLTEAFSPLIGVNLTMKNSLSLKAEYRKQRNLALNVTSVQLTEGHTSEFVIGGGYTIKNLSFITKNKDGAQKKVSNDLKIQVDLSYKDVKMLLRKVEEGLTQVSSGNKVFAIKISADYVLSQKINLQLFYDHQGTTPLISSSYPVKADNVGLNIKLMLTR